MLLLPCHRKASLFGSEVHHARGKPVPLLETGSRKLYLYHEIVVILGFNDISNELVDTLMSELFPSQQQSLHCRAMLILKRAMLQRGSLVRNAMSFSFALPLTPPHILSVFLPLLPPAEQRLCSSGWPSTHGNPHASAHEC